MVYREVFYERLVLLAKILIVLELFDEYYRRRLYLVNRNRELIKKIIVARKDLYDKEKTKDESNEKNENPNENFIKGESVSKNNIQNENMVNKKDEITKIDGKKDLEQYGVLDSINSEECTVSNWENKEYGEMREESVLSTKIPVVISEKKIIIPVEMEIELEEEALEIKGSSHKVYLNEAILIPIEENKEKKGKLFLKGFVRSSLEYSTIKDADDTVINGKIKHVVIYIPFKCTTIIQYSFLPEFRLKDGVTEITLNVCHNSHDNEDTSITEENITFNEEICCYIKEAKISGTRICDKKPLSDTFKLESIFTQLKEKMIVELCIALTQRQCVNISNKFLH